MSMHTGNHDDSSQDELERLLLQGVSLQQNTVSAASSPPAKDEEENRDVGAGHPRGEPLPGARTSGGDIQGVLRLFAEAAQDMATAGVELGLGRHFACAAYCNQTAEKAAQAVSLLRFGHLSTYDHDLRALGALVSAPQEIQD